MKTDKQIKSEPNEIVATQAAGSENENGDNQVIELSNYIEGE